MDARKERPGRQDVRPPACGDTVSTAVGGGMRIEEYADRIAAELHERVEHQRRVFRQVLSRREDDAGRQTYCPLVDCDRLSRLRAAVQETIDVLEETRSSFKSKRLEVMRKALIDILAEV
ncbi:MAG: hypothetical protein ACM3L8_04465 [Verrucomicrobiota bacterium]